MSESNIQIKDVFDAVQASSGVRQFDDESVPFVLVPDGYSVHDLEHTLPRPLTTKQGVQLEEIESFIAYVLRFKGDETSIFAPTTDYNKPLTMRACIDYHGKGKPSHARHSARLNIPLSLQWQRWIGINGVWKTQTQFAHFLSQNLADVVEPSQADILEVTKTLEATKNGQFKSGVRLENGSHRLLWSEEVTAKAGGGRMEVPQKIAIAIPIFKNDQAYRINAFFRIDIDDGKLKMQIELERAEYLFEQIAKTLIDNIAKETDVPLYRGTMS